MKAYKVKIIERFFTHEIIEAESAEEAKEKAEHMYEDGDVEVNFYDGFDVEIEDETSVI